MAVCSLMISYAFPLNNGRDVEISQQDDEVAGTKQLQLLQKGEK